MKFSRIRNVAVASAVMALCATGSTSAAFAASDSTSVHVPAGTALRVADQLELLETPLNLSGQAQKIPFTVQYSAFVGAPAVFQAFQAGDVDFSISGDSGLAQPQEAGVKFEVVAASVNSGNDYGLLVAPGETITSPKQLKGKKIGYSQGTALQSYVLSLLKDNGLTPSDVDLVNLPSNALASAVQSGDVDVATTADPLEAEYENQYPGAKVLVTPNVYSGLDFYVASTTALRTAAKSAAIADYLERLTRGYTWVDAHLSDYVNQYYGTYLKLSSSILPSLVSAAKPTHMVLITPSLIKEEQGNTNLLTAAGSLPGHLDVSKIFTTKFNKYVAAAEK